MIVVLILVATFIIISSMLANSVFKTFNKNMDTATEGLERLNKRLEAKQAELKRKKGKS